MCGSSAPRSQVDSESPGRHTSGFVYRGVSTRNVGGTIPWAGILSWKSRHQHSQIPKFPKSHLAHPSCGGGKGVAACGRCLPRSHGRPVSIPAKDAPPTDHSKSSSCFLCFLSGRAAAHLERLQLLTCTEDSLSEVAVILHVTDFSHHHNGCLTDRKEDSLGLSVLEGQVYCGETWWSSAGHKHGRRGNRGA